LLEVEGVELSLRRALARYGAIVLEAGGRFNLTGAKSPAELFPHLLDSLTVLPYAREPYVDVGSGAGFPAIPLAIAGGIPVTLVESTLKKARFLESAMATLGVRGTVVAERAEQAAHREDLRERFASGTARAIGPTSTVAELLVPFIAVGGVAVLQRGRVDAAERRAAEDAALMLGAALEEELAVDGDRRILLIRKERPTASRFPRRAGLPAKRPLCT
jgi:16S rRNA (guanine527-N7)-methyltransferase